MEITKTVTNHVQVAYKVVDGAYTFMDTFTYATAAPMTTKAIDGKIATDYAKWKAVMTAPVPAVTKETLTAERTRALADKVAAETKIATLTAAISKLDAVVELVKEEPEEMVK